MGPKKRTMMDKKDAALLAVRVGASALPFGGPVATILSSIKPSYHRQLSRDVQEVDKRLMHLEGKVDNFTVKSLKDDDSFKAAVAHWVQIAIRTSDQKKREALRNAVVNSAIRNPAEEDLCSTFFKWVDDLESTHVRILDFLNDPVEWAKRNGFTFPECFGVAVFDVLAHVFPEFKDRLDFYAKGLIDRGMLRTQNLHILVNARTALSSLTTPIGKQFLAFITSPIDNNENGLQHTEEASKS